MAYDWFNDENKPQQGGQNQGTVGNALGAQSPIVTGNSNSNANTTGGTTAAGSGQFTNLQNYLNQNQGAQFGQQVAGQVQNQLSGAQNTQNQFGQGFRGEVDKNTVNPDQNLYSQVGSNPTGVANDPTQFNEFTSQRDAQYKGPKNVSDSSEYGRANQDTTNAESTANLVQTEPGRMAYLNQQYGKGGNYTAGQAKLDNLLISNDKGSQKAFGDVANSAQNVQSQWKDLQDQLNSYAGQGAQTTAQARAGAREAVGIDDNGNVLQNAPMYGIQKAAQGQADQANAQAAAQYAQYQKDLASRQLTPEEAQKFGLTNEAFQNAGLGPSMSLYRSATTGGMNPVNLSNYLSQGPAATRDTAATQDQVAREAALSKLANVQNTFLPNESLAGTYDPNIQFATDRLLGVNGAGGDLRAGREAYTNAMGQDFNVGINRAPGDSNPNGANFAEIMAAQKYNPNFANDFAYQDALNTIRGIQNDTGYQDTLHVGAANPLPTGSWQNYQDLGGTQSSDNVKVPGLNSPIISDLRNPNKDPLAWQKYTNYMS